jgi:hypothetical protein
MRPPPALFVLYVVLGHRIARDGGRSGIDRLAAAMLVGLGAITRSCWARCRPSSRPAAWRS